LRDALIKQSAAIDVELIESSGGVFEVKKDGRLIFSKRKLGRFPEHQEIIDALR
jgi:selenoprotein W-related protein